MRQRPLGLPHGGVGEGGGELAYAVGAGAAEVVVAGEGVQLVGLPQGGKLPPRGYLKTAVGII